MGTILRVKNPANNEWLEIPVIEGQPGKDGISTIMVNGMTYEAQNGTIKLPDYASSFPTQLGSFINDVGFIDKSVDNLTNYYSKTETYNKTEVNGLISNRFAYKFVETLPPVAEAEQFIIYMIHVEGVEPIYEQYILNNDETELVAIGNTQVDLSDYITTTMLNTELEKKQDKLSANDISNIASITSKANIVDVYAKIDTYSKEEVNTLLDTKQDTLIAGDNITITGNTISSTGGSGGIPEAPEDDKTYGRKNATWVEVSSGSLENAVLYVEQTLTDEQKIQAKENIGITESNLSDTITFIATDLVDNKLTITHTRNTTDVIVSVYSDTNLQVIPSDVKIVSDTEIEIDFAEIEVLNTWKVVVQGGKILVSNGTSYTNINDKPSINNNTLVGNQTSEALGLQSRLTAGTNISIENGIISASSGEPVITTHNALNGRNDSDAHSISSITGLESRLIATETGYAGLDTRFQETTSELQDDILQAYINSVSYPVVDQSYNALNTWITFDNKIYRCIKDTIWTGVVNSDWQIEYMTIPEVHAYVAQKIQEFEEQQFPLQMRPDANFGVYQTKAEFPLVDNVPGYLVIATNDNANSGIYIWGIDYTNPTEFMWQPFVVIQPISEDTLNVTFNGEVVTLKVAMGNIITYIDAEVQTEVSARTTQFNGLNTRITSLETKALTVDNEINATVFRGTQAEYDLDPNKDNYYLALIVEA